VRSASSASAWRSAAGLKSIVDGIALTFPRLAYTPVKRITCGQE
jgi:hypothetical protein